jgi:hypothetical protein
VEECLVERYSNPIERQLLQPKAKEASMTEDRDMSGVLFSIHESKRKNVKRPTHGHVIVHGEKQ